MPGDGYYRVVCEKCDHRSTRWPWRSKATIWKQDHNRKRHGGAEVAEVVDA